MKYIPYIVFLLKVFPLHWLPLSAMGPGTMYRLHPPLFSDMVSISISETYGATSMVGLLFISGTSMLLRSPQQILKGVDANYYFLYYAWLLYVQLQTNKATPGLIPNSCQIVF